MRPAKTDPVFFTHAQVPKPVNGAVYSSKDVHLNPLSITVI